MSHERDLADQDVRSWIGMTRVKRFFGGSFVGALAVDRELDGRGYNRVFGPDFQWKTDHDTLTGQFLLSRSSTPDRPELAGAPSTRMGPLSTLHMIRVAFMCTLSTVNSSCNSRSVLVHVRAGASHCKCHRLGLSGEDLVVGVGQIDPHLVRAGRHPGPANPYVT